MRLTWEDAQEIAERLVDAHPGVDPLSLRFVDLHRWVTELGEFADDPKASTEGHLEKIQMAWLDEIQDRT